MVILSISDVLLGLFGVYVSVGYFSGKTITRIASDLAFLEGAVVFCAGSVMAFYRSRLSSRYLIPMIVGVSMIAISVVFGLLM